MKKHHPRTKFSDPMIVPRVKNYLAENVDKTFVDVSQMARSLKERYREYNNRSESAFCQMVEAAYKVVLHSYGLDDASSSDGSEEESDDLELLDDSNTLNNQMTAIYKMQNKKGGKKDKGSDKTSELIDILSSDEESNNEKAPKLPKLNDQITISPHVPDNNQQKPKPIIPIVSINATTESSLNSKLDNYDRRGSPPVESKRRKTNNSNKYNDDGPNTIENDSKENAPPKVNVSKTSGPKRKSTAAAAVEKPPEKTTQSKVSFDDIGGIDLVLEQVCDLIMHMKHPEVYKQLGVKTPRGALLHGPPGTGKTLLANAIAGRLGLPLIAVAATEMVGGLSGESEERIRELFEKATVLAPCVLFIDEIDSICSNRMNAQKDMEKRIVAQLLSSMDGLAEKDVSVLVLAATNNPDSLDPALRRAGRLEQEIALGIPTLSARKDIIRIMCRSLNLDQNVNLDSIAQLTPGFVGADLQALINKSCTVAIKRVFAYLKEKAAADSLALTETTVDVPIVENSTVMVTENGEPPIASETAENAEVIATNGEVQPIPDEVVAETVPEKPIDEITQNDIQVSAEEQTSALPENFPEGIVPPCPETTEMTPQNTEVIPNSIPILQKLISAGSQDFQKYLDSVEPFTPEQLADMRLTQEDILTALKTTKPCAIREGFATVPDTTWEDIGSLTDVRRDLQLAVLAPVKYPEQLETLGLTAASGVLLCGPPGCGKTLLAKAVANEAGINFISVKGPELLNMYVGESERAVRTCFRRARNSAPCVIFFDEFDSLCPRRVNGEMSGAARVVNQLLTEMDGVEGREGVFVLAATNRPDIVDPAVLRPGRLDRVLFVGMPLMRDRVDILKAITKKGTKPMLSPDVELEAVAAATEGYTGADLAGLVRLAATQALTDFITGDITADALVVSGAHFRKALSKMRPSVSAKEQQHYEKLRQKYASAGEEKIDIEMDTEESMDTV